MARSQSQFEAMETVQPTKARSATHRHGDPRNVCASVRFTLETVQRDPRAGGAATTASIPGPSLGYRHGAVESDRVGRRPVAKHNRPGRIVLHSQFCPAHQILGGLQGVTQANFAVYDQLYGSLFQGDRGDLWRWLGRTHRWRSGQRAPGGRKGDAPPTRGAAGVSRTVIQKI